MTMSSSAPENEKTPAEEPEVVAHDEPETADVAPEAQAEAAAEVDAQTRPEATDANEGASADLLAKLDETTAEVQKWRQAYLRSQADLENFRKRAARERDELRRYAVGELIEELLPPLDNMQLGLTAARDHHPEAKQLIDGLEMVLGQLRNVLNDRGVQPVEPVGDPFDPNLHEAVAHEHHDEVPEHHVVAVQRTGYQLGDRLLRPASVVVSKGPTPADETARNA